MKKLYVAFVGLCLAVCLTPLAGMSFRPTTVSTENRTLSAFPAVRENGRLNLGFFQQFEQYFNEHFAFRNELVYADSVIQAKLFQVSADDGVICGTRDWLYYSSTLGDFLGTARLSERELHGLAHNLALVERYVRSMGADFAVAVPPNKNTLYGENMPYYASYIVDPVHNLDLLAPQLQQAGVTYADLYALFAREEEIYYLRQDSHWNNRGALMAYNCILDTLAIPHDDYAAAPVRRALDHEGDLSRMLYTLYGKKGADYHYELGDRYRFVSGSRPDEAWVETESDVGRGSLLMFRDSFGDTMLPFFAGAFEQARFTKESPCGIESLMTRYRPDTVVLEKVERNLSDYLRMPPILQAPEVELQRQPEERSSDTSLRMETLDFDPTYYCVSGTVEPSLLSDTTDILVELGGRCYEAYYTENNGFLLYLKKTGLPGGTLPARVLTREGDSLLAVWTGNLTEEARDA